jgi:hypothetical protein
MYAYPSVVNLYSAADLVSIIAINNSTGSTYLSDMSPRAKALSSDYEPQIRVSVGGGLGWRVASGPASRFVAMGPKSSGKTRKSPKGAIEGLALPNCRRQPTASSLPLKTTVVSVVQYSHDRSIPQLPSQHTPECG